MKKYSAILSKDRVYRYMLDRRWNSHRAYVMFIGLNPSTADETEDDPTIRRCMAFAKAWGYGSLCMMNLFAFRATEPNDMRRAEDPIGPDNNTYLLLTAKHAEIIVAAWGTHGTWLNRGREVRSLLPALHHLGLTKHGQPKHPLYLSAATKPRRWK